MGATLTLLALSHGRQFSARGTGREYLTKRQWMCIWGMWSLWCYTDFLLRNPLNSLHNSLEGHRLGSLSEHGNQFTGFPPPWHRRLRSARQLRWHCLERQLPQLRKPPKGVRYDRSTLRPGQTRGSVPPRPMNLYSCWASLNIQISDQRPFIAFLRPVLVNLRERVPIYPCLPHPNVQTLLKSSIGENGE